MGEPTTALDTIRINKDILEDFKRDVYCLFGLPVDNLSLSSTVKLLREIVASKRQIVLATLNVNWIISSLKKPDFRAAILNSDICTLDGRPLIFFSRILGLPMRKTAAGSSLVEHLLRYGDRRNPISIFLFGGDIDTAKKAYERINSSYGGLKAVGYYNPGFGSVEEMANDSNIKNINSAFPDILLVALGAYKGSIWIDSSRKKLNASIISHLGATINFLAGSVKRAPLFLRKIGLEWVWRILEEPFLFKRYLHDGLFLLRLTAARSLKFFKHQKYRNMVQQHANPCSIDIKTNETQGWITLTFGKQFTIADRHYVRDMFCQIALRHKNLIFDFRQTEFVDPAFFAYLLLLIKHQKRGGNHVKIINIGKRLREFFYFNFIFDSLRSLLMEDELIAS